MYIYRGLNSSAMAALSQYLVTLEPPPVTLKSTRFMSHVEHQLE